MYVDSKPASLYSGTQGWKMPQPSPQPPGSLKTRPLLGHGPSSFSLRGMEQAIPSFRTFVSRTPPPSADQYKPLPPTPLIVPRRASSASPPKSRSKTPSLHGQRRSSSVYSRTVSQWFDDDSSWQSADLRDDPIPDLPPLPMLQPVAYSKSTPHLAQSAATPTPTLEPRTCSPLIMSPSPTASHVTTPHRSPVPSPGPSPLQQENPWIMCPTSPHLSNMPKKHVHTVSLEEAKAAIHSTGAVHLLPEELRAQTLSKSRSFDPIIRKNTLLMFDQSTSPPPELPQPPTLVDNQGRHRSLQGQKRNVGVKSQYPYTVVENAHLPSPRLLIPERVFDRPTEPFAVHARQLSGGIGADHAGLSDHDEPRGRTLSRSPRSTGISQPMPKVGRVPFSPSPPEQVSNVRKITSDYQGMLPQPFHQASGSPAYDSDDSIGAKMRMVPQPLFKYKPAAKMPGEISSQTSEYGSSANASPLYLRADSVVSRTSGSSQSSAALGPPSIPGSTHSRTSTTGSIPISPPMVVASASPGPTKSSAGSSEKAKKSDSRNRSQDDRVSMYYPYVGSRKGKKFKEKKKNNLPSKPSMPLLPADSIAKRRKPPGSSTATSRANDMADQGIRKSSTASSDRHRPRVLQRLAGSTMRYADLISRPSGLPDAISHKLEPLDSTSASQHSPHLLPSTIKGDPPSVHLGWSDSAKTNFDRSRGSGSTATWSASPRTPQSTRFVRITTAPHPIDGTNIDLREPGSPVRKGSIFGGLLDGWKEKKKEDKREELKKTIRVIPQGPPPTMRTIDIEQSGMARLATAGPSVDGEAAGSGSSIKRRMSAFGWM